MDTLFNKVLCENIKVLSFYFKPNELFGQPNILGVWLDKIYLLILSY